MVVCTLCSCYPWPVLGLPPVWYKSAALPLPRGRPIRAACWRSSGLEIPEGSAVRVWDSTAEIRYLVIPMRPEGTDGWSEEQLS